MRLLAHARKDDVLSRHASRQRARQLSARNDIGAKPFALHHFEHGQVGVGLDCKGDVRIGQMRQRRLEHPRVALQRGARIDVNRRADRLGNHAQRQVFGVHNAVAVVKMIHG